MMRYIIILFNLHTLILFCGCMYSYITIDAINLYVHNSVNSSTNFVVILLI